MAVETAIYPSHLEYGEAVESGDGLLGDEDHVCLRNGRAIDSLTERRSVRRLWCLWTGTSLEGIDRLSRLEHLLLDNVRATDLSPLAKLRHLRVLSITGATRLRSLDWLAELPALTQLRLHAPLIDRLDALGAQPKLRVLAVSGTVSRRTTVDSLEPIGRLERLQRLDLLNLSSRDGSLSPLSRLSRLEHLNLAREYHWRQFADLGGKLPRVECNWFEPWVHLHEPCESCSGRRVMLTGKRQPTLCLSCRPVRALRHLKRFEEAFDEARTRLQQSRSSK
ncbi:MAG: hypothetical protein RL885_04630 [Planctomycetota bacterium]